jgi:hypothetical protein
MNVSLFELHQLYHKKIPLKITDDRIPKEFQNKIIEQFNTISPRMIGGYLLKVENFEDVIRLGGKGNIEFSHDKLNDLKVEICL